MKTRSQTLKRKTVEDDKDDDEDVDVVEEVKKPNKKTPSKKEKKEKKKDEKNNKNTQPKITDFYKKEEKPEKRKKKTGYDEETGCWHCLECGENMGATNSRQLCGKYYCYYSSY